MEVKLTCVKEGQEDIAVELIQGFWKAHNDMEPSIEDSRADYREWTQRGHCFYLVQVDEVYAGFAHLASRGVDIDWLEDLFILPDFQGRGIGSRVIQLLEERVKQYSTSLYLEVSARNLDALRLYHRLGYDCMNTVTIRKDFEPEQLDTIREEQLNDLPFKIKKRRSNKEDS